MSEGRGHKRAKERAVIGRLDALVQRRKRKVAQLEQATREAQRQTEQFEQARREAQRQTEQARWQAQAGLLKAIAALCGEYGIELTGERQALLCSLEAAQLLWLLDRLQSEQAWPLSPRRRLVPTLQ